MLHNGLICTVPIADEMRHDGIGDLDLAEFLNGLRSNLSVTQKYLHINRLSYLPDISLNNTKVAGPLIDYVHAKMGATLSTHPFLRFSFSIYCADEGRECLGNNERRCL